MGGDGRAVRMSDKVGEAGEKAKFGGIHARRAVLDLKGFGFGHDRKHSESEVNRKFSTWPRRDTLIVSP